MRTHFCGLVDEALIGQTVTLCGWADVARDLGGLCFIDLRDHEGIVQIVAEPDAATAGNAEVIAAAAAVGYEDCLRITGVVRARHAVNDKIRTGKVEVVATKIELLNKAEPLPFHAHENPGEDIRLKYRYLDLRTPAMQRKMRTRTKLVSALRHYLDARGFQDIETPILTKATPEGARDFLVPARMHPGEFYALPQSPQLFKQILMMAGFDRYYQIARCFRDEALRADRQLEFTQLDMEFAWVDERAVQDCVEGLIREVFREVMQVELADPFPRLTYAEAMRRFGSDKPDLRFGQELVDCTEFFADTPFRVFQAEHVGAVVMPGGASQSRKELDAWQDWAKARGARGLAYVLIGADGLLGGPTAKNLSDAERAGLAAHVGASGGDAVFFAAGTPSAARTLLGAARLEIGRRCGLIDESAWSFVWVVDAPLFEPSSTARAAGEVAVGGGAWTAVHHAFTSPKPEWLDRFDNDPEHALAYAYDLVCNGNEIGGGSIRIHRRDVQERVFAVMGLSAEEAQEKFGFLLEAFAYGAPPHGGIAFGWDRICALLAGADSIREVIAFPKSGGGYDPLTGAPAPITPEQRREAGVDAAPEQPAG